MTKLQQCGDCRGFLPRGATKCPHCAKTAKRAPGKTLTKKLCAVGATLGAGSLAFTLMACYGMPPCPDGQRDCHRPPPSGESEAGAGSNATDHPDGGK